MCFGAMQTDQDHVPLRLISANKVFLECRLIIVGRQVVADDQRNMLNELPDSAASRELSQLTSEVERFGRRTKAASTRRAAGKCPAAR